MTRFSGRAGAPARRGSWSPSQSSHDAGRRGTLSLCWSITVAGRYSACWSFPSNGEGGPVWPCVPLSSSGLEACKFQASITTCPAASLCQKWETGASPTGKGLWFPSHLINTKDSGFRGKSQGVNEEGKPAGLGPGSDPACLLPVFAGRSEPPAGLDQGLGSRHLSPTPWGKALQPHCMDLETGRKKAFACCLRSTCGHSEGSGPTHTLAPVCPEGQEPEVLHVGWRVGWSVPGPGGPNPHLPRLGSAASSRGLRHSVFSFSL